MRYEEARKKLRVFRQLTGTTTEEFDKLNAAFAAAYEKDERQRGKPESPAGRKAVLRTSEDKLFFLLFYLRHYPTQEVLGFLFGISQGQANQWIHRLTPILKKALADEKELPGRTADSVKDLLETCPELVFLIDGTERPIRRPQDGERRRKDYSGKKKRHTKRNIVITEMATGKVLGLGATQPGSKHDKACVDEENYSFPSGSTLFQDTGFQGYAPEGPAIEQPTKKPRGKELTPEQKEENRKISRDRVLVEHSIGGVKVFHVVSTIYRNIKKGFDDLVMETVCGLFNFVQDCRNAIPSLNESGSRLTPLAA
jgi:DDE superfamily endonuclease/Helix-turn-helix of DDE superfamily endonuclease